MSEDEQFEKWLFGHGWKKVIIRRQVLWIHKAFQHPIPFNAAIRKQAKMTRKAQRG